MPQLRHVDVSELKISGFASFCHYLTQITRLTPLSMVPQMPVVMSNPEERHRAAHTALAESLPLLAALRLLEMGGLHLGATGAAVLRAPLAGLMQLTYLGLRDAQLGSSQSQNAQQRAAAHIAAAIASLPMLASLDLRTSGLAAHDVPALARALQGTTQLRSLLLDVRALDVAGAQALRSAVAASAGLTQLAFSARVQAETVTDAAQMPARCSMLEHLQWSLNMTQARLFHCADLQGLQRLTHLNLSGMSKCMAPNAAQQMLLTAPRPLTRLEHLNLSGAHALTRLPQRRRARAAGAMCLCARASHALGTQLRASARRARHRPAARVGAAHSAAAPAAPGAGQQCA
jgi:hypothetical protein